MNKLSGDRQKCVQLKKLKPPGLDFLAGGERNAKIYRTHFLPRSVVHQNYFHLLALGCYKCFDSAWKATNGLNVRLQLVLVNE